MILFQLGVAYTVTQNNTDIQLYTVVPELSVAYTLLHRGSHCVDNLDLNRHTTKKNCKLEKCSIHSATWSSTQRYNINYILAVLAISVAYIHSASNKNTQGYHSITHCRYRQLRYKQIHHKKEQTREVDQYIGKINYQFYKHCVQNLHFILCYRL